MTTPYETMTGSPFEADHPAPEPTPEKRREIAQAEAYVRSRFYPPLPVEYGALAVQAVDLVNAGQPYDLLDVSTLPIQPKGTDDEGQVTAAELVEVLRLEHLIEDDDDFDMA